MMRSGRSKITSVSHSGFGGWSAQASISVPDPLPWDWSATRSTLQASHGEWSLEFIASGVNADGTVWVERSADLPAGVWEVQLEFDVWSPTDADIGTWEKIAFIGTFDPEEESHFTMVGLEDVGGWKTYTLTETLVMPVAGPAWVAFGFNIVFETSRTHYFDLATIRWSLTHPVSNRSWSAIKALYR